MGIKLEQSKNITKVVMYCDLCYEKIQTANDGEYLIPNEKVSTPIIGHYKCTKQFEDLQYKQSKTIYGNMGLDYFVFYLANNLKVNFKQVSERAAILDALP